MLMMTTPSSAEALEQVGSGRRIQPYRAIHKGLRQLMMRTLNLAATLDASLPDERDQLAAAVEELLRTCADHLEHENTYFHAPLRQRAERAVLAFEDDHQHHLASIEELHKRLAVVKLGTDDVRQHAYALYLELTRFVAENFEHMADEETQLTLALWQHFSDEEIEEFENRLRASLTPQENAYYLRWIAVGSDATELADMARQARASMPADAFEGVCALLSDVLPAPRWTRLARELGVPPVPGFVSV